METKESKTKPVAIFLVLCCSLLGAVAQILLKFGSNHLVQHGIKRILMNYWLIGGYASYSLSTLLFIIALKNGELSVLYPIIATTYVWVTFFSPIFFSTDSTNLLKLVGVTSIVVGVISIGVGSKK